MSTWRVFWRAHHTQLKELYPGITEARFIREASEIGGDGFAFLQGEPFAYLLGYAEFHGLKFQIDRRVLIPRPETEQMADLALTWMKAQERPLRVVDVGTGSGCLGLTLAHFQTTASVLLTDISDEALKVAGLNLARLAPQAKLQLADLLEGIMGPFDLIVSNPPYIPRSEDDGVHPQVKAHEPHLALYVDDSTYEAFFRRLFIQARAALAPGGLFLMEGQSSRLSECAKWAKESGFQKIELLNDWAGALRFLRAGDA